MVKANIFQNMNTETGPLLIDKLGKIQQIDLNACIPEEVRLASSPLRRLFGMGSASKALSSSDLRSWQEARFYLEEVQKACGKVIASIIEEQQRKDPNKTITEDMLLQGGGRTNGSSLSCGSERTTCLLPTGASMSWSLDPQSGLCIPKRITSNDEKGVLQLQVTNDGWVLVGGFPRNTTPGQWLNEEAIKTLTSLRGSHHGALSPFFKEEKHSQESQLASA